MTWEKARRAAEFISAGDHFGGSLHPFFGNQLGELVLDGEGARFRLWVTGREQERLRQVLDLPLTRS